MSPDTLTLSDDAERAAWLRKIATERVTTMKEGRTAEADHAFALNLLVNALATLCTTRDSVESTAQIANILDNADTALRGLLAAHKGRLRMRTTLARLAGLFGRAP